MNELATRVEALALLHEYTQGAGLLKHALAVEAAMRAHARRLGADEEAFGIGRSRLCPRLEQRADGRGCALAGRIHQRGQPAL